MSDYSLSWHLSMQDVALERIRADRVLHEAIVVDVDPLHLVAPFNGCMQATIDYSTIARSLLDGPIENTPTGLDR